MHAILTQNKIDFDSPDSYRDCSIKQLPTAMFSKTIQMEC